MNILIASPDYFADKMVSELPGTIVKKKCSANELKQDIANYDIVLTRVDNIFDKEVLQRASKLKIIGTATIGLNHIDLDFAKSRKIQVVNIDANALPTAEYTFSLIMAAAKRLPWSYNSLMGGSWNRAAFFGTELKGKTLGIVGFGRIGSLVAKYAQAFEMRVITYDPYINVEIAQKMGVAICSLDEVLRESDILTLHVFLSPETKHMINTATLATMKPSTILINASRGEVIDDAALVDALETKKISAAALDVFSEEPLSAHSKLMAYAQKHQNLLLTPHLAASTIESVDASAWEVIKKVKQKLIEIENVSSKDL